MVTSARRGVYGGTFDPPHLGHLILACEAAWQLDLDEVWLVPVGTPSHRAAPFAGGAQRLAMVAAAVVQYPHLRASAIEVERPGVSYTIDTLEQMAADDPDVELTVIIGADQVETFDRWRSPDRICELARLGIVARGEIDRGEVVAAGRRVAPGRTDVIEMPTIDISSTMIRARIAHGSPVDHLLPHQVWSIVTANRLYGARTEIP